MKTKSVFKPVLIAVFAIVLLGNNQIIYAQSTLDCSSCHPTVFSAWQAGSHSHTQKDIASELAVERIGQSADTVINGADGENCIACHSPLAVTTNGGMTDVQALGYYFSTTTGGLFSDATDTIHSKEWPHNYCTTCHNVPAGHNSTNLPKFGFFNSLTSTYDSIGKISSLCGQCHGNLQFEGTDHLTYNAWSMSKHAATQNDVADELAEERSGESADTVILGSDAENCIACHAPTAVLKNGGMTEVQALNYFFSTENGVFTNNTTSLKGDEWPDVSCISCHNPHEPNLVSYFNSSSKNYEVMNSSAELCGQCHGNLRFSGTDHLSYNIEKGVGALGVPFKETMPGITCTDCHMSSGTVDDTKAAMYHGHSWSVFVTEEDGSETVSCQKCHPSMDAAASRAQIQAFKDTASATLSNAEQKMNTADSLLNGSNDSTLLTKLDTAKTNLALVEGDESGGFHNHNYQMDLLADITQKLDNIISVVTGINENNISQLPAGFKLSQNYPNPFYYSTNIRYSIPYKSYVHLNIYDLSGRLMKNVVNEYQNQGVYDISVDMSAFLPGIYYYRLKSGDATISKTMILSK